MPHTPTPWVTKGVVNPSVELPDGAVWTELRPATYSRDTHGKGNAPENAAFIVRAVNAHGPLVSALELLLHHEAILDDDDPRLIQTRAECHAALKLAKGE